MKDERKKQIIKAALKRFIKHGFSKTSLDEIARDIRIGKATLYYYFNSKDELYRETLNFEISIFLEEINNLYCRNDFSLDQKKNDYIIIKKNIKEKYILIQRLIENMFMENLLEEEKIILFDMYKKESSIIKTALAEIEKIGSDRIDSEVNSIIIHGWGNYFVSQLVNFPDHSENQNKAKPVQN